MKLAATNLATYLADSGRKFAFLRKNFLLLIAWPIAALIMSGIGWNMLITRVDTEKVQAEQNALKESAALARSFRNQFTRAVEAIDQILLYVKYGWESSHGNLKLARIQEKGLLPPTSLLHVSITDRNGSLLTSTIAHAHKVSVAHEPYFLAQKNAAADSLYIGVPVFSSLSNRHIIPFSRILVGSDGSFDGIVAVTVIPAYFTANYDETLMGQHGLVGVIGNDGIIRATRTGQTVHPPETPALVVVPQFAPKNHGSVILEGGEWFADKRTRFVGWDAVDRYPLIVLAGLDEQETMAPYWAHRTAAIDAAIWNSIALAVFTLIAMALSMRLAWRKYKMESTQASYRLATEEGNEGFYIFQPVRDPDGTIVDFEIVDTNHRGAEILRERRDELVGKRITTLYENACPERLMGMLRQAVEKGFYEDEVEVPGESPFTMRWAYVKIVRAGTDLAITLRDISDTKAHVAELERRSNEDALTGLPNRHWVQTYLPRAIEHAKQNNTMLALLFVDLDGFKKVNDTAGHAAGDEVLRHAARRIKDAIRPHDQAVRLGGDEFLVILEQIAHRMDAAHVAERIVHAFHESFKIAQGVHLVGSSVGISLFPSDGTDAETLLHNGDIAMYSVKTSGKGNYNFFDQKFYDAMRVRHQRESELRHAIEHDQFLMYYQPRVDVSAGTTCSMEALVRWTHPEKGLLEPLEFIPLAEETGLILNLGELVIDKVCMQVALWAQSGQELVPVSINVSSRQFNEVDIAKILLASLERHHIEPGLVEVEVTESSMMGNSKEVSQTLTSIQSMGIKLLVDDFGTGYSSLSQLQRLKFDMLKVDRAFTTELGKTDRGSVFFKAIITMAHALGMRVVAEGVENETQLKILKSLLCDQIQGFYISKPLPPSETQPILPKWFLPSTA